MTQRFIPSGPIIPLNLQSSELEIDWSHPFNAGLLFRQVGFRDLVENIPPTPSVAWGSGSSGSGRNHGVLGESIESFSVTNGSVYYDVPKLKYIGDQQFLTFGFFAELGNAIFGSRVISVPNTWFTATTTDADRWNFTVACAGPHVASLHATGGAVFDGSLHQNVFVKDGSQTTFSYKDGGLHSSVVDTAGDNLIWPNTPFRLHVGGHTSGSGVTSRVYQTAVWARALTAGEIREWNANPRLGLRPKVAPIYFIAAGGVTGIGAQTLEEFTQLAIGVAQPIGVAAQTVELFTQVGVGVHTAGTTGIAAQTLELLVQVVVGLELFTGTSKQTLELFTQVGSGKVEAVGAAAQTLELITQLAAGVELFTGTAAQVLELFTQVSSGAHTTGATGTANQTLESLVQTSTGVELFTGTVEQTLESLSQLSSGSHTPITGTAAQVLELLTQVIAGIMHPSGTVEQTLELLTQVNIGVLQPSGIAAQTLEEFVQLGVGTTLGAHSGTAEQTLELLIQAAVGLVLGVWGEEEAVTGGWTEEDAVTDGWTEEDSL